MNPIVLIPARLASTRLPDKPLAMIAGLPMIVRVMKGAQAAAIGEVAVACDGPEIAEAVKRAGGKAIITDPALPSGSDRIWQALQTIDPGKKHGVVVNLQGDMPLFDPAILKRGLELLADPAVDIGTLAAPIGSEREKNDPAVVKVVVGDLWMVNGEERNSPPPSTIHHPPSSGRALSFSRSYAPGAFHHIGIYVYRRAALEKFVSLPPSPLEKREKLEQLRALEAGMRIEVAIVDAPPLGVDTPEGLERVRNMIEEHTP